MNDLRQNSAKPMAIVNYLLQKQKLQIFRWKTQMILNFVWNQNGFETIDVFDYRWYATVFEREKNR